MSCAKLVGRHRAAELPRAADHALAVAQRRRVAVLAEERLERIVGNPGPRRPHGAAVGVGHPEQPDGEVEPTPDQAQQLRNRVAQRGRRGEDAGHVVLELDAPQGAGRDGPGALVRAPQRDVGDARGEDEARVDGRHADRVGVVAEGEDRRDRAEDGMVEEHERHAEAVGQPVLVHGQHAHRHEEVEMRLGRPVRGVHDHGRGGQESERDAHRLQARVAPETARHRERGDRAGVRHVVQDAVAVHDHREERDGDHVQPQQSAQPRVAERELAGGQRPAMRQLLAPGGAEPRGA